MCGIVGLFSKSPQMGARLGGHLGAMVAQMAGRGPDSAGVAIYRDPVAVGQTKICLFSEDPHYPWAALCEQMRPALGCEAEPDVRVSHALIVVDSDATLAQRWPCACARGHAFRRSRPARSG